MSPDNKHGGGAFVEVNRNNLLLFEQIFNSIQDNLSLYDTKIKGLKIVWSSLPKFWLVNGKSKGLWLVNSWNEGLWFAGSLSHTNPQLDCEFFIKFSLQLSLHSSVSVSDESNNISDETVIISDDTTP